MAHFSVSQALVQLRHGRPQVVSRNENQITEALSRVDSETIRDFRNRHPRATTACVLTLNRREIVIKRLDTDRAYAEWNEIPLMQGEYLSLFD